MAESSNTRPVRIHILNKEYPLICPLGEEEALQQAAHYLEKEIRELRNNSKSFEDKDRLLVVAALNITHKLLTSEKIQLEYQQQMIQRISKLQEKIENNLQPEPV